VAGIVVSPRISLSSALAGVAVCAALALFAGDWLLGVAVLVLLAGVQLVWTDDGLFVLPAAYAFHWVETSIGLVYKGVFDRDVPALSLSDYRPMVLISLGCCLAMAIGVRLGLSLIKDRDPSGLRPEFAFPLGELVVAYLVTTSFEGTLVSVAAEYPTIRQILVTADTARLGILFLLLRRLLRPAPRWAPITGILVLEVGLGLTGFFAGFREPLVLAGLALLEIFDRRSVRHWVALAIAGVAAVGFGLLWMGVRGEYRRNYVQLDTFEKSRSARLESMETLALDFFKGDLESTWQTADNLVDRMWPIYYPALAVARVPSQLPHTNGEILSAALVHIVTPRVLFPDKPGLQSDSDKVRKYSGVMVAGVESNTTIAFGYAAEAYIDFGVPMMFLPVLGFGIAIGALYSLFGQLIRHHDIHVAFATVAFWLSMYLFERSWATMLGVTLGLMVYLGAPVVLLDRFLLRRSLRQQELLDAPLSDGRTSGAY
jgi:hypothetical protein